MSSATPQNPAPAASGLDCGACSDGCPESGCRVQRESPPIDELPPPFALYAGTHEDEHGKVTAMVEVFGDAGGVKRNLYTADQMHAYARQALAAQPAPVVVTYQGLRQQKAASEGVCLWSQQDDGYDTYSTGCGHEFTVNDCTDGNVQLPYCPYCALSLESMAWSAGDKETPAQPAPVVGGDWTTGQCLEFASVAFRHAVKNLPTGVTLQDIRMGAKRAALLSTRPAESVDSNA